MPHNRILYIDAGPAKTGTSALQHLMRHSPPKGLYYPKVGQWNDGAHHGLILAMDGKSELNGQPLPPLKDQLAQLDAEIAADDRDVLISSEGIRPIERLAKQLDILRPISSKYFDEVQLIYTLRHPFDRATSGYNQAVKDAHVGLSLNADDYLGKLLPVYLLAPIANALKSTGLKVHYIPYGPEKVANLLQAIGHPLDNGIEISSTINKSINGSDLLMHFWVNTIIDAAPQRITMAKKLKDGLSTLPNIGPTVLFSEAALAKYEIERITSDKEQISEMGMTYPTQLIQSRPESDTEMLEKQLWELANYAAGIMNHSASELFDSGRYFVGTA